MDEAIFREVNGRFERTHWWFVARRRIIVSIAERLLPEKATILDIGCGTGGNIAAFFPRHRCVGIDPSATAISIARRTHPGVEFREGHAPTDVMDVLPKADLVLLTDVLEHVADDRDLLFRLVEQLPDGAHVLITVPAEPKLWSPHDVVHGHHRRYTAETLSELWRGLPVRLLLLAPLNRRLYYPIRAVRAFSSRRGRAAGEAGTDFSTLPAAVNHGLELLFRSEKRSLVRALDEQRSRVRGRGVSLVSVLRVHREVERDSKADPANG